MGCFMPEALMTIVALTRKNDVKDTKGDTMSIVDTPIHSFILVKNDLFLEKTCRQDSHALN